MDEINGFQRDVFRGKTVGLPMVICTMMKWKLKISPRIQVSSIYSDDIEKSVQKMFYITIETLQVVGDSGEINQDDLEKVKQFITRNKVVLLKHWNNESGTGEFFDELQI